MSQVPVLVVDDEDLVRQVVAENVQSLGYICSTASDGLEALELIKGNSYEVIISDVRMPRLDGLELMEKARQIRPSIPFIIITGYTADYPFDEIIEAGANDLINKPFKTSEIKFKLERIFRERQLNMENSRLLDEQVTLNEKLSTLLKVSRDLIAEQNFDRLFGRIISEASEIMEAERSTLYLIDWEHREIWTKVAEQIDPIRLPLGEGISGRVAENGKTINVTDARELPYFNREFDLKNNFRTRSVLCMPIYNRKKDRIGVIQILNKKNGHRFNQNDETILQAIISQVAIVLENYFLIDELQISFESSIRTLSATVDARHPLTAGHSQRVTDYSLLISEEMGMDKDEIEIIKYAALLHDIGKIGIRDEVLLKQGIFTPEERDEMMTHPLRTRNILENFHFPKSLRRVPFIASQHHEKVNGKGYPSGLTGDELTLGSKILAVTDVFDALTSRRDYPKYFKDETMNYDPMPLSKVIEILKGDSGSHFDPYVVETFLRCIPRALYLYRGSHFSRDYVDETIRELSSQNLCLPSKTPLPEVKS